MTFSVSDRVAWVELSNPGRLNAFTWSMYDELALLPEYVNLHSEVRAVVFRGAGGAAFAAGTDINQFVDFRDGCQGIAYEHRVGGILDALSGIKVPTIAVVDGPAVGAGLAVAAVCDIVLATPGAVFGAPIARTLGNCLPAPVIAKLQGRLGVNRTMKMLLTATMLTAEEAYAAGFVSQVLAPGDITDGLSKMLKRITTSAPLTLASVKEISRRLEKSGAIPDSDDLLGLCYGSEDFREGVTAFLEHRHPVWKGQ
ncbi:enoyl-CoA hydratase [Arthrobacter sp. LjRoot14]|uniref:enoyl-CoA hydratase n=1 Tax=Arthrobacter sp. LjRoot14 TaxID=3342265 RepID=UPI003ECFC8EE